MQRTCPIIKKMTIHFVQPMYLNFRAICVFDLRVIALTEAKNDLVLVYRRFLELYIIRLLLLIAIINLHNKIHLNKSIVAVWLSDVTEFSVAFNSVTCLDVDMRELFDCVGCCMSRGGTFVFCFNAISCNNRSKLN